MNIWLVMSGEPLALYGERPHRVGILSEMLISKGHKVTWWTTTFDHQNKRFFYDQYTQVNVKENLDMNFLHSNTGYKKNISLSRINNHREVAECFKIAANQKQKPDLIFCAFPTIDLAYQAVLYGKKSNIPVIVDVRDLWPDIFLDPFPGLLKPLVKLLLTRYFKQAKYIFNHCNAITAVSGKYLEWAISCSNREKIQNDRVFPLGYQKVIEKDLDLKSSKLKFKKMGLDESKILVWFVGTFGQTYDLLTVINAAKLLECRNDIQFILTGDGEKKEEWLKLAQGAENIIFTGWVDKLSLTYLSQVSTVGLMAYKKGAPQGLPNKVFEYLSAGLPILSSLQTETKSLLENEQVGLTYMADDINDFVLRLKELIDNKSKLSDMGDKASLLFESKYSSSIIYENVIDYFENDILKGRADA